MVNSKSDVLELAQIKEESDERVSVRKIYIGTRCNFQIYIVLPKNTLKCS